MECSIATASVFPVQVPLRANFAIAGSDHLRADNVVIKIQDDLGNIGIGEAAPFPILTGDDQNTAAAVMREISGTLVKKEVTYAIHQGLLQWRREWLERSPTALAAVETALWDLRARQLGLPLRHLFGHCPMASLETDLTIPILPISESQNLWKKLGSFGFRKIKFKVGGDSVESDADRVIAMCRTIQPSAVILDGNQGLTVDGTLQLLKLVAKAGIHPLFFEQPLPEDAWEDCARLSQLSPIPICVDETVRSSADAIRVVRERTAQMINLKFMKSGISEALAIAAIAKAANLGLMIGGMVESEITMTASLHFACGLGTISWQDLDTPFFLESPLSQGSPFLGTAELLCPTGKGLGLTWDAKLIDTFLT